MRPLLERLGSTRLTLVLLPALAAAVVAVGRDSGPPSWALAFPLGALAMNLAAAIATHAAFRAQPALLAFHLALLALVALAAAGRLTYLQGSVELSEGEEFSGRFVAERSGPLHPRELERAVFVNLGFSVDYEPGLKRARTRNRIAWTDAAGRRHAAEIGDDTPLKQGGYRIYTTSNKGFAPEFVWVADAGGPPARGTVHLPSFPAQLTRQETEWTPPGATQALALRLEIEERLVDLESRWTLRPPGRHVLEVNAGAQAHALRPGDEARIAGGTLHYVGLRTWMGYTVAYDRTLPWMLASALLAATSLTWHFAGRWKRRPWPQDPGGME